MTVCSMTRSKVKVTSPRKSEIRPFSKAISSPIYNGGWQVTRILRLGHNTYSLSGPDLWFLSQFWCHATLKLAISRSRPPVPYGANLFVLNVCVSVSIPKQVLHDSYKVKPHRRRSFDATDSCALSRVGSVFFLSYPWFHLLCSSLSCVSRVQHLPLTFYSHYTTQSVLAGTTAEISIEQSFTAYVK